MSLRAPVLVVVFALVGALLPAAASADDCMCAFGAEDATPWSVLTAAIEADRRAEAAQAAPTVAAANHSHHAEHVLWCVSGDDPRCSPRRPGHETPAAASLGSAPPGVTQAFPPLPKYAGVRYVWTIEVGHAQVGVRSRVERPPRV